jgi:hypothetical protein
MTNYAQHEHQAFLNASREALADPPLQAALVRLTDTLMAGNRRGYAALGDNARLITTWPRVPVALMGMEKVIPRLIDLPVFLKFQTRPHKEVDTPRRWPYDEKNGCEVPSGQRS